MTERPRAAADEAGEEGIVVKGASMGGGSALFQAMLWPDAWRRRIAWLSMEIGGVLPRLNVGRYVTWPPDAFFHALPICMSALYQTEFWGATVASFSTALSAYR